MQKKQIILPSGQKLHGPQSPDQLSLLEYHPLVCKWAHKYKSSFDGFDDAYQTAFIGLLRARDKWEPKRGPFGSIVTFYIRETIGVELEYRQSRAGLALPERTRGRLLARQGHKFHHAIQAGFKTVSAEAIGPDGKPISLLDLVPDPAPTAEELIGERQEAAALKQRIDEALSCLSPRERRIIRERYMTADKKATLEIFAKKWGLSPARIQQIDAKALAKLRAALGSRQAAMTPPVTKLAGRRQGRAIAWEKDKAGRWQAVAWR